MTEQIFNLDNTDVKCGEGTNILNNKNKLSSPSLYERTGQAVSGRAGLAAAKLWLQAAALHLLSSSQILAPAASPGSSCSQKQQLGSSPELAWEPPNSDM